MTLEATQGRIVIAMRPDLGETVSRIRELVRNGVCREAS
jgi:hypothetical protein